MINKKVGDTTSGERKLTERTGKFKSSTGKISLVHATLIISGHIERGYNASPGTSHTISMSARCHRLQMLCWKYNLYWLRRLLRPGIY